MKTAWRIIPFLVLALALISCRTEPYPTPTVRVQLPTLAPNVTPTAARMQQYTNPIAFDMLYPVGWLTTVARQGIIIFGTQGAVDLTSNVIEPSVVVYRQEPNSSLTLAEYTERFVEAGPTASGYEILSQDDNAEIDGRAAIRLAVRRDANEEAVAARAVIYTTEANNGYRYIVVATTPEEEFPNWTATFELMLSSFTIKE